MENLKNMRPLLVTIAVAALLWMAAPRLPDVFLLMVGGIIATLIELLKVMESIPMDIEGDAFGRIYEYFLGKFAMSEGQKGGEFFTPTSLVRLIVNIIEPFPVLPSAV